jgi:DNA-binding MarR family transcriptional regulator
MPPRKEVNCDEAKTTRTQNKDEDFASSEAARGPSRKKVLSLIGEHPGIRPSELNRLLNVEQSDSLRDRLIRRGFIRKEKDGSAMRYYLV